MSQGAPRNRPRPDGPRSDAPGPDASRPDAPRPDSARGDAPRTGTRPDGGRGVRPSGARSSGGRSSGDGTGRRRRRVDGDAPRPTEGGPAIASAPAPVPLPAAAAATPPGQALERLRARVLDAVRELERLRVENDTLAARVAEMEVEAGREPVALALFDGDPAALRRQIEGFVEALDALLIDEDGADRPA